MIVRVLVDEAAINQALSATFETRGTESFIRIRPNAPQTYFPSQESSIVLTFEALDALIVLAKRNGWKDTSP